MAPIVSTGPPRAWCSARRETIVSVLRRRSDDELAPGQVIEGLRVAAGCGGGRRVQQSAIAVEPAGRDLIGQRRAYRRPPGRGRRSSSRPPAAPAARGRRAGRRPESSARPPDPRQGQRRIATHAGRMMMRPPPRAPALPDSPAFRQHVERRAASTSHGSPPGSARWRRPTDRSRAWRGRPRRRPCRARRAASGRATARTCCRS